MKKSEIDIETIKHMKSFLLKQYRDAIFDLEHIGPSWQSSESIKESKDIALRAAGGYLNANLLLQEVIPRGI